MADVGRAAFGGMGLQKEIGNMETDKDLEVQQSTWTPLHEAKPSWQNSAVS